MQARCPRINFSVIELAGAAAISQGQSMLVPPILSTARELRREQFCIAAWYLLQETAANFSLPPSCGFHDC